MNQTETAKSPAVDAAIRPFRVNIPQAQLDDLRRRIKATVWPERENVSAIMGMFVRLPKYAPQPQWCANKSPFILERALCCCIRRGLLTFCAKLIGASLGQNAAHAIEAAGATPGMVE